MCPGPWNLLAASSALLVVFDFFVHLVLFVLAFDRIGSALHIAIHFVDMTLRLADFVMESMMFTVCLDGLMLLVLFLDRIGDRGCFVFHLVDLVLGRFLNFVMLFLSKLDYRA